MHEPHYSHFQSPRAVAANRGFTLIEVMITVAIIGILAAIALPSYRDYVLRGQLVDATNLLSAGRANMERYFQDNRTYANVGTVVNPCDGSIAASQRTAGSFVMTCGTGTNAPTGSAYTIVATGSGPTNGFTFSVNNFDTRSTTVASPAPWPAGTYACWYVKKGAC